MEQQPASTPFDWGTSLSETYVELSRQIVQYAPSLIGAFALLVIGYLAALILRSVAKRLTLGLETLFSKFSKASSAKQQQLRQSSAQVIGKVVFWTVILFFVAASANTLGWNMFSGWLDSLISYLPNLLTGLAIILGGYLLSNGIRSAVLGAASSAGLDQPDLLARTVQVIVLLTMTLIGIEQIGIQVGFLTTTLIVVIGVLLASGALAFGLGARDLIANVIGAQYARKHCRVGEIMQIGDCQGEILEITQTSVVLDCKSCRTVVPGQLFQQQLSAFGSAMDLQTETNHTDGEPT